jgi:PadR family transcriptional regulator, regulatory protein PadR
MSATIASPGEVMVPLPTQFLQGTVDLLILHALVAGPRHGYAIASWLESTSGGNILIEDAALYTALHKMEDRGWITAEWALSDKGKRAKFYELSAMGRAELRSRARSWQRYVSTVTNVLRTEPV